MTCQRCGSTCAGYREPWCPIHGTDATTTPLPREVEEQLRREAAENARAHGRPLRIAAVTAKWSVDDLQLALEGFGDE